MHQRAEYGVAAHWKYKERMTQTGGSDKRTRRVRYGLARAHFSDWQAETKDPRSSSIRCASRCAKEVYVFTPKGRVIGLPAGGTTVDFAYAGATWRSGYRTMGEHSTGGSSR